MPTDLVIGHIKRAVLPGELVRLSDFEETDLIMGVVRTVKQEQQRIGKQILKRKLRAQEKQLTQISERKS